jgi:hypothetical protein
MKYTLGSVFLIESKYVTVLCNCGVGSEYLLVCIYDGCRWGSRKKIHSKFSHEKRRWMFTKKQIDSLVNGDGGEFKWKFLAEDLKSYLSSTDKFFKIDLEESV